MDSRQLLEDLAQRLPDGFLPGLYRAASIDRAKFLVQLQNRGLSIGYLEDLARLDLALIQPVAESFVRSSRRVSALSGVGSGMAGWVAIAPEAGHAAAMLLKLAQRLSLLYGIDYTTPEGELHLWKAIAEAVGVEEKMEGVVDAAKQFPEMLKSGRAIHNPMVRQLAQAVMKRLILRISAPFGRMVPIIGGGIGGWSNYREMGRAGHRMMRYYERRRDTIADAGAREIEVEIVR